MDLKVNDRVELKKTHPCGSKEWLVLRIGMDIKLGAWAAAMRSWRPDGRLKKASAGS